MILDKIINNKKQQLLQEKDQLPINQLVMELEKANLNLTQDFIQAIKSSPSVGIIGEVKKSSPSKGLIKVDFNPVAIAKDYAKHQVAAISVLTERKYFKGSPEYLKQIRQVVETPLLCKDFIIDAYQVYQARLLGADCILLIVAALSPVELKKLYQLANGLSLQCLVEVHNRSELDTALALGANLIGINNRDLKTFQTTLETTEKLMKYMPKEKVVISESGIHTYVDLLYLKQLAVDGVLIGESLMRAPSIGTKLRELRGDSCG